MSKASIKTLNEVMRNPKIYAQTKALYSYLWCRADYKSGLAYPPKKQMQQEINLSDNMINEGLGVLEKLGYIEIGTAEGKDKETQKPYTYTTYQLIDASDDIKEDTPKQKAKKSKLDNQVFIDFGKSITAD